MIKQRVLVIGGSGFIGKCVVEALAASDWATPVAASRRLVNSSSSTSVERQQLDATDRSQMALALRGVSSVINCVAADSQTIVSSARVLFSIAAEQRSQPRIVHLSSVAVYGSAIGDVDESAPLLRNIGAYGAAKVEAEQQASRYGSVVILRPGIVYGPGSSQWSDRIGRWLLARRIGDLGALGDGYCNLIYIDDLVAAILQATRIEGIEGQRINLGMLSPPTWNEYFSKYAIALGAVPVRRISRSRLIMETKVLAVPRKIAEIIAHRIGLQCLQFCSAISPAILRLWGQELRMSVAKAQSLLNVNWTSLSAGLQQSAGWFAQRGNSG